MSGKELSDLFQELQGLGRDVVRDVSIGEHVFTMAPISTDREIEIYQEATEESGGVPSNEGEDRKVGPEYLLALKTRVLADAVVEVDGISLRGVDSIEDVEGTKREPNQYLLKIIRSWPSEVSSYMFVEYNRLQVDMANKYEFTLAHKALTSSLENILRIGAQLSNEVQKKGSDILADADSEGLEGLENPDTSGKEMSAEDLANGAS